MDKKLATIVFPFYYIISPLISIASGKSMDEVNKKIWFKLRDDEKNE